MDLPIRYVGFEIPNRFAIGYGLDHAERFRNLSYVAALRENPRAASPRWYPRLRSGPAYSAHSRTKGHPP